MSDEQVPPKPTAESILITVEGPGIKVQREISPAKVLGVLAAIFETELPALATSTKVAAKTSLSLTEFFRSCEPKRNPDKILTIALYMQSKMGKHSFSVDELKPQFRSVGEPAPANFARDFKWAIKNSWISEVQGESGQYYVTRSGEEAVNARFSEEIKKTTSVPRMSRRRRRDGDAEGAQ